MDRLADLTCPMERSSRRISFHVDPSDGLCTLVDSRIGDQSTWNATRSIENIAEVSVNSADLSEDDRAEFPEEADAAFIGEEDEHFIGNAEPKAQGDVMFFKNQSNLCHDLRMIMSMPDMCDVTFLVGKSRTPVHGVRAILSTRSQYFFNLIMSYQLERDQQLPIKPKSKKGIFRRLIGKLRRKRYYRLQPKNNPERPNCLEIPINDFNADVFQRVVLYLHSGRVNVTLQTAIGVMNAADSYGLYDLRTACLGFAHGFIKMHSALALLLVTEHYEHFKWTRILVQDILDFVCENAEEILLQPEFLELSKSMAITVLERQDLKASEESKWNSALQWSRRHCQKKGYNHLRKTMRVFISSIRLTELSVRTLETEVKPLGLVPENIIGQIINQQAQRRCVIGHETPCAAPPKPPRRKNVTAAILAPVSSIVRLNSSIYVSQRRLSQYLENEDSVCLKSP